MSEALTIGRMAAELGVSTHTLRYYEQAGLLLPVSRTDAGHRLYARTDMDWLRFVMRLKATGMSIAGMQAFAALRARGDETAQERLALLIEHRQSVLDQLAQLQTNLTAIDEKIRHYEVLAHDMTRIRSADDASRAMTTQLRKDLPCKTPKRTPRPPNNATRGDGTS